MSVFVLTQTYLKKRLKYYPLTGIFVRLPRSVSDFTDTKSHTAEHKRNNWNAQHANTEAMSISTLGYVVIGINGCEYKAHRLAWLYMEGYLPEHDIDHIDQVKHNNIWSNLRHVSRVCNTQNQKLRATNTSGVAGVSFYKRYGAWVSRINVGGKRKNMGYYENFNDAVYARYYEERINPLWACSTESSAKQYLIENKLIFQKKRG